MKNAYPTERERLIAKGLILPLEARPTLRMTGPEWLRAVDEATRWLVWAERERAAGFDPDNDPMPLNEVYA